MKSKLAIVLLAAFTFSCQMQLDDLALSPTNKNGNSSNPGLKQNPSAGSNISNEVLIKFKSGISESGKLTALKAITGTIQEQIVTQEMKDEGDEGFYVVKTNINAIEAINRAAGNSFIEIAEPNQLYTHQQTTTTPDDYFYNTGQLWGLNGTYGSNAHIAWASNTGSSTVYIGIVDEGVMYNHPDLINNMWTNPNEIVDGLDNDKNGLIDDIRGWDFANNDASVYDGSPSDDVDAHGTHVSGTIGGLGNNSIGIVGMNWNVKLIPAKFMGTTGGTTANAIKALDYLTNLKKTKKINIVASNNSWGGGSYSKLLLSAIQRADRNGILFIAAAGNSGTNIDITPFYPASYSSQNIVAVSAIDVNGLLPTWSNYGAKTVALGAPGANIISTVPGPNGVGYAASSGTSMATPHVAAAVALYAAKNYPISTNQSASQVIKKAIINNTIATPSLSGKTITGGRLNVGVVGFY